MNSLNLQNLMFFLSLTIILAAPTFLAQKSLEKRRIIVSHTKIRNAVSNIARLAKKSDYNSYFTDINNKITLSHHSNIKQIKNDLRKKFREEQFGWKDKYSPIYFNIALKTLENKKKIAENTIHVDLKIPAIKRDKRIKNIINDNVNLKQAATRVHVKDPVMYSYSDKSREMTLGPSGSHFNGKAISKTVYSTIMREMNKAGKVGRNHGLVAYNSKARKRYVRWRLKEKRNQALIQEGLYNSEDNLGIGVNSVVNIGIYEVKLDEGKIENLSDYEIRSKSKFGESYIDNKEGIIKISKEISSNRSVQGALIGKNNYLLTNIDIVYEKQEKYLEIPLFESYSFNRFLQKNKFEGKGGFLFVSLEDEIEDIEIDHEYEGKLYLSEKFINVSEVENYKYILFIGVDPGNVLMTYSLRKNKLSYKISMVAESEVTYELAEFLDDKIDKINVFENGTLSKKDAILNLDNDQIMQFISHRPSKKVGPNRHEFNWISRNKGFRKYLEFTHLSESIFVGFEDKKSITIPSNDFIVKIFKKFKVDDINDMCLVQLNIGKKAIKFDADLFDALGNSNIETKYLNLDGTFESKISNQTTNIFILAQRQGVIYGQVEYLDGTTDFLKTYCSIDTYLIEQF